MFQVRSRDLIDVLAVLAPVLAIVVAVGVAVVQAVLQRQALRQDLFNRRFDVYDKTNQFLDNFLASPLWRSGGHHGSALQ